MGASVKLGVCYNIFDGHELLGASIRTMREVASFVCVVYQTTSNFGSKARPFLREFLGGLRARGEIDDLIEYEPRRFNADEKRRLVSVRATAADLGGGGPEGVQDQFFNELVKREIGRRACFQAGCSHFMSMDADEFYHPAQLRRLLARMIDGGYDAAACLMRVFYHGPAHELLPRDSTNHVLAVAKCQPRMAFRLASPYPVVLDPTRRLERVRRLLLCARSDVEMLHYSLVRMDMRSKLANVSNRSNYTADGERFLQAFARWSPDQPVVHPHSAMAAHFTHVGPADNWFGVDFSKERGQAARFCSERCSKVSVVPAFRTLVEFTVAPQYAAEHPALLRDLVDTGDSS